MPIGGFLPASQSLGQKIFPDDSGGNLQAILQQISAGQPHFDPASVSKAPVPLGLQSTPGNAARGVSPGGIGGGIEGGLPFSVQSGLGTGTSSAGGGVGPSSTSPAGTSSVVGGMLSGSGGGSMGGTPTPMEPLAQPSAPSNQNQNPSVTIGQTPSQANMLAAGGPSVMSNPVVASIIAQMLQESQGGLAEKGPQGGPGTSTGDNSSPSPADNSPY